MKLVSKQLIAAKTVKRYDTPKSPYQRVLESKHVSQLVKQQLRRQLNLLNPFQLRKTIESKLKNIYEICQ